MDKIVNRDWADIQKMQRGIYSASVGHTNSKIDSEQLQEDKKLLDEYGIKGLKDKHFYGSIDRLECAGLTLKEKSKYIVTESNNK